MCKYNKFWSAGDCIKKKVHDPGQLGFVLFKYMCLPVD